MSDFFLAEILTAIGTIIVALFGGFKIILDYKATTKKSSEVLTQVVVQMKELHDKQDMLTKIGQDNRQSNRDIIRYRIREEINVALERGYEYTEHYSEVVHLYHTYKKLDGNGVIDSLFERYEKLPLKEK